MKDLVNSVAVSNRPYVAEPETSLVLHEYNALSSLLGSSAAIGVMARNGRDGVLKSLLQYPGDVEDFLAV